MPIRIECECGKNFDVPDEFAGTSKTCYACGNRLQIQTADVVGEAAIASAAERGLFTRIQRVPYLLRTVVRLWQTDRDQRLVLARLCFCCIGLPSAGMVRSTRGTNACCTGIPRMETRVLPPQSIHAGRTSK